MTKWPSFSQQGQALRRSLPLVEVVAALWGRARRPFAHALIVLLLLANVLGIEGLSVAALFALAVLAIETLFGIRSALNAVLEVEPDEEEPLWFPDYRSAITRIEAEIASRLERGTPVTIQWLAVTGQAAWPICQDLLLKALRERREVTVELALMSPAIPESVPTRPQIQATLGSVENFLDAYGAALAAAHSHILVCTYRQRPNWHAALINDDILFFTPCYPLDLPHAGPQNGVEIVVAHSSEAADARIAHFRAWFDDAREETLIDDRVETAPPSKAPGHRPRHKADRQPARARKAGHVPVAGA